MLNWVFLPSTGGECLDLGQSILCRCQAGFTGPNCQVNVDNCASSPCQNAGTCQDGVNDYTCSCTLGYTGKNCSIRSDACGAHPCQNGGTCFTHFTGPVCQCPKGFMGPSCEFTLQPSFKLALRQTSESSSTTLTISCLLVVLVLVLVAGILFLRRRRIMEGRKQLTDIAVYNDLETVNNLGGSEREAFLSPHGLFKISNSTARLSLSICPDGRSGNRNNPVESSLARAERQDFMWRDEAMLGSGAGLRWSRKIAEMIKQETFWHLLPLSCKGKRGANAPTDTNDSVLTNELFWWRWWTKNVQEVGLCSSKFKTQRDKDYDPVFIGPTKQTKCRENNNYTTFGKVTQKISLFLFSFFVFYLFLFFSKQFCLTFQSSFGHYFLIVRTINFILYIIYLLEIFCLCLHFDCHRWNIYLYNVEWRQILMLFLDV